MKIMYFIHGMSTGGAETIVKDYALNIDSTKFEISILCFERHNESPYENILKNNNINIIYINDYICLKKSTSTIARIIKKIHRYFLVRKIIKNENPDILHTHLLINSYVKYAKVNKKCKLYHTVHSDPNILWKRTKEGRKDFKCAKYLIKKNNMKIIVLHDKMRKVVNEMFEIDDSIILNNGIDISRFNTLNVKEKDYLRKKYNIPKDAYVLGHIGRFCDVKNHDFIIKIFSELHRKNSDYYLLLIGSGPNKNSIISKLDNMGLKGKYIILSNRDDIPDLLSIMDYFIFPSLYEGMPVTVIEAQEMKLPCFISDTITNSVIISNIVTKISLEKSEQMWADIIIKYKYPKKIVINDKEWDIKYVIKKLEEIYTS